MTQARNLSVRVCRVARADPDIALPGYETAQAAGMDIRANLAPADRAGGIELPPGARVLVPTGLAVELPGGFELQLRPRSGLALRHGITLLNAPGTIDADYRGEIGIILINHGDQSFTITHGARLAQMVLAPVSRLAWDPVADLARSGRGDGGFGSTGS